MCGIAGVYWAKSGSSHDARVVDRMKSAILHRGPDSDGRYQTPFSDVGFRRLSIIDLAGGDQPLSNEDGSIQCFLNGEIYNYLELRKELQARGHAFRTSSDTEVLPHLYEEYGTGMFCKLNGMFAICLIDIHKKQVLLARDRFGVKQLYYAQSGEGVLFASEMKAILASGLITAEVEESAIVPYLSLFYCPGPGTLLQGVSKLPAGCWMRLDPAHPPELQKYYSVPENPEHLETDLVSAAERTRELLWRAVELQLQADVPVGISLSGGIDSSAIACAAKKGAAEGAAPIALTIYWPDTSPEEVGSARELCAHLGLRHEVLEIPVGDVLADLPLLGWISDEPVADPATYSQYCVAREAAKFVKVLLGGAGGDELFGGYGIYKLSRRYSAYEALPEVLQRGLRPILPDTFMDGDSLNAVLDYRNSRLQWHSHAKSNLSRQELAILRKGISSSRDPFENFRGIFERYRRHDPVNQQMIVDFETYLPEQILTMMDRATMAASIEGRVPFLDNGLVDFAFSLPAKIKMGKPPETKRVLKRAIAKDVPAAVLSRRKLGMPSPFMSLLAGNFAIIRQILLASGSFVRSVLPEEWLRAITRDDVSARQNFRALYAILTLEIWHKLFIREGIYSKPEMSCLDLFEIAGSTASK